jgi:hypothetical protein
VRSRDRDRTRAVVRGGRAREGMDGGVARNIFSKREARRIAATRAVTVEEDAREVNERLTM